MSLTDLLLPGAGRLSAEEIRALARLSARLPAAWRVGHVWPSRSEQRALAQGEAITQRQWSLRYRAPTPFDALLLGKVNAPRAHQSALGSCRLLAILDSVEPDLPPARALGNIAVGAAKLWIFRGDLCEPLLRVDDYPTGVRPILEDLSSLHEALTLIDAGGVPFYLGIVPAILTDEMVAFLRGLRNLVVCMHGFEHGYAKHSRILIEADDRFNQRCTVTGFDEFAGRAAGEIEDTLRRGRDSLAQRLGKAPVCYIPPNNESSRHTAQALVALGFELVLSEKRMPGSELPCWRSDFYGRSPEFQRNSAPRVASLHATWEADLLRAGDRESLPKFMAAMVEQRTRASEEVARVAAEILSGAR